MAEAFAAQKPGQAIVELDPSLHCDYTCLLACCPSKCKLYGLETKKENDNMAGRFTTTTYRTRTGPQARPKPKATNLHEPEFVHEMAKAREFHLNDRTSTFGVLKEKLKVKIIEAMKRGAKRLDLETSDYKDYFKEVQDWCKANSIKLDSWSDCRDNDSGVYITLP